MCLKMRQAPPRPCLSQTMPDGTSAKALGLVNLLAEWLHIEAPCQNQTLIWAYSASKE